MKDLQTLVQDYLTENFNYNPTNDLKAIEDYKIAKEIDEYADGVWNFKSYIERDKCIVDNLNVNMLIDNIKWQEEEYSFIYTLFYWGFSINDLSKSLKTFLSNLTIEDSNILKDSGFNKEDLVYITFFNISSFPCVYDVLSFEYTYNQEPCCYKLQDPFYSFPELNLIKSLQDKLDISTSLIIKVLDEDFYDYATYSVGDYNSDLRDETNVYYQDYLKPFILSNKRDMEVQKKVDTLNQYLSNVEGMELELEMILLGLNNPSCNGRLKNQLELKKNKQINKLKELPKKYYSYEEFNMARTKFPLTKELINKELNKLLNKGN
jgi:hypothetical protein